MDTFRNLRKKITYLKIILFSVIIVSIIIIYDQDKRIEDLVRRLYSPKNSLYTQETELKLIATCDGGLSLSSDTNNLYFLVQLRIENRTTKTQEFITYSCAALINVLADNKDVNFFYQNCSANHGTIIKLNPKQQFELPIMIQLKEHSTTRRVKFGYIILRPDNINNEGASRQLEKMREKKESVIWSEPIDLRSVSFEPYRINDIIISSNK